MSYVYEITNYPDSGSLGILSEILLVTICISTAIFLRTKNPYISYFSTALFFLFYFFTFYQNIHLIFLVLAMTAQALVNIVIQKQVMGKEKISGQQAQNT